MLRALTAPGAFGTYAAFNVIAFVLIYFFVPETKQLTLEELNSVFSIPTAKFARYQTGTVTPYWFRKVFIRRKGEVIPPLLAPDAPTSRV